MSRAELSIKATNLSISYGDYVALTCDSLSMSGTIIALIGHNGAGKSTFIKAALGLLPIHSGTLSITTPSGSPLSPERHMAFCPETGAVFGDIPVESYIQLWCRIKIGDPSYYRKGGARFIDLLEISPLLKKLGRELSKGQRRRVQTAIGFLTEPQLFLFDEPFDGLDVQKSSELSELFSCQSEKTSFLISSHRMDVVERLADQVIVLKEGRIAAAGTVEDVCRTLSHHSMHITNICEPEPLLKILRDTFPSSLVTRSGDGLAITGKEFTIEAVSKLLAASSNNGATLTATTPTLTDAMNYHLRLSSVSP